MCPAAGSAVCIGGGTHGCRPTEKLQNMRRGRRLPTVVPTDSRPLSWPPIGALPRNRLASSATGGASPISPTTRPHRASSPRLRRAGCPHLAAATHRALKTPCHCEPVRTLVWQSVLPPRTAPHKGNGLPRRSVPRNDIFIKMRCPSSGGAEPPPLRMFCKFLCRAAHMGAAAGAHRTSQTCHCEPARRLVWQSVIPYTPHSDVEIRTPRALCPSQRAMRTSRPACRKSGRNSRTISIAEIQSKVQYFIFK